MTQWETLSECINKVVMHIDKHSLDLVLDHSVKFFKGELCVSIKLEGKKKIKISIITY